LIRMGVEASAAELYNQLLMHPDRYFFILITGGRAILCIQTCDRQGENPKIKEIDCLSYDSQCGLISIFQEDLREATMKQEIFLKYLDGDRYPISIAIGERITKMPGLIEWIISSVLSEERCLQFYMN
jgi:hypothetical protein